MLKWKITLILKPPACIITFVFCLLIAATELIAQNDPSEFLSGVRLQDDNGDMKPGPIGYSAPCVGDWNGDGNKDLLVGTFLLGNIYFYPNSGSNSAPEFTGAVKLKAGGNDISMPYD